MKELSLKNATVQLPVQVVIAIGEAISTGGHGGKTILTGAVRWDVRLSPETNELSVFRIPNGNVIDGLRSRIVKLEIEASKKAASVIPEAADGLSEEQKESADAEAKAKADEAGDALSEARKELSKAEKKYQPVCMKVHLDDLPRDESGNPLISMTFSATPSGKAG